MDAVNKAFDEEKAIKLLNFLLVGKRIIEVIITGFWPTLKIDVTCLKYNPSPYRCMGTVRITIDGPLKIGDLSGLNGLPLLCCEDMPACRFIEQVDVTDSLLIRFSDGLVITVDNSVETAPDEQCWSIQTLEDDRPDALRPGIEFSSSYDGRLDGAWDAALEELFAKSR